MGYSAKTPRATFPVRRPIYYYITDRKQLSARSLAARIRRAVLWGVDLIQIREKDLTDRDLHTLARRAVAFSKGSRCRILINGRADVALSAGAHGVHLPADGIKPGQIRPWVPDGFIIGASVHSVSEGVRSDSEGADYLLFGPIFPTPSKTMYGPPLGLSALQDVCECVSIPIIGLGGIGPEQIRSVLAAGAAGVAGIRIFQKDLRRFRSKSHCS